MQAVWNIHGPSKLQDTNLDARNKFSDYSSLGDKLRFWLMDSFRPHKERLCEILDKDLGWE